jgi:phosphate-selective porin OprO/OprP
MGAVGVYGDSINNQDNNFASDEQTAISGRFTWAPIFESSPDGYTLLHLGVSVRERYQGDDSAYRYRTRPLNARGNRHIDAGANVAGQDDTTIGFEIAGQYNAFGFQGEYAQLNGETPGGVEFDYDAYYFDVYWTLTGEPRAYRGNQGSFGALVPQNPLNEGGPGLWMLSGRYDYIDLSDPAGGLAGSSRGEQTSYAVGVDWIPIDHVRFKLNYAQSEMDRAVGVDDEAQVITLRTQFDF